MKETNKGFTLMELLIVIGVLGILAAGLLAAIDPFEQLLSFCSHLSVIMPPMVICPGGSQLALTLPALTQATGID